MQLCMLNGGGGAIMHCDCASQKHAVTAWHQITPRRKIPNLATHKDAGRAKLSGACGACLDRIYIYVALLSFI